MFQSYMYMYMDFVNEIYTYLDKRNFFNSLSLWTLEWDQDPRHEGCHALLKLDIHIIISAAIHHWKIHAMPERTLA